MDPTGTSPWRVKLDRAAEHLANLRQEVAALKTTGDLRVEVEPLGRERIARLVMRQEPPLRLSAIVGDFVHNARSALDCLAVALCEAGAGRPLTQGEEGDVLFPITASKAEFRNRAAKNLATASQAAVDLILSFQPFYLADQVDADAPMRENTVRYNPLRVLQRLSNIDKHRRIHLTVWYPRDIWAGAPPGVDPLWRWARGPWVDGSEIGRWVLPEGQEDANLEHGGEVDLVLEGDEHRDHPLTDQLDSLLGHVRDWVVYQLEGLLP